ncbi:hypothetical protein D9757_001644 [Collybiopsis confluens]|uniref:Uncharacterized protein n=1 Tax=Collybiopsis confluens TaxID=2823264 RepID=A0A8H5HYA5_9AGAR|nr:hypothetical protein D9757_001644 [Collybiopsis confluens]
MSDNEMADRPLFYQAKSDAQSASIRDLKSLNLPPMTFRRGKDTDEDDSSSSEFSDEETESRNKPLPDPPTILSPPQKLTSHAAPSISRNSNFSTSTVSSYVTASSVSSVPGSPIYSRDAKSTTFDRVFSGGYHLPTMVAGKSSPTVGYSSSLPLLNDTDVDCDSYMDSDGHFATHGREMSTSRLTPVHLTRQPSLGTHGTGHRSGHDMSSEPASAGVMRRYASAGDLLSRASSRSASPLGSGYVGHQYSHSHPLPFPAVSPSSPNSSSPPPYPRSSSTGTPIASTSTRSRAGSHVGPSRVRSRAGSTVLRNAVYIEALDSNEVERRLLNLASSGPDFDVPSGKGLEIDDGPDANLARSKWSPASSVVDLRPSVSGSSTDNSLSFGWGFPKPPKLHAPPPTPCTPSREFLPSHSSSSVALADDFALRSQTRQSAFEQNPLTDKRISVTTGSIPGSSSLPDHDPTYQPATSGKRQRLASFIAKMAGGATSRAPPVPSTLSPPSSPAEVRSPQHRPPPLELSLHPSSFPAGTGSIIGNSEPSTPAYSISASSWDESSGFGTDTETEDEIEDMDPDLIAMAAGLDVASISTSLRTPRPIPSPRNRRMSYDRTTEFPMSSMGLDEVQMGRGSYAQVYGFRSPKMPGGNFSTAHSFTHPTEDENSVPRGATPTVCGARSLISPKDLPPHGSSPETARVQVTSTMNAIPIPITDPSLPPLLDTSLDAPLSPRQSPKSPTSISPKSPNRKSGRMSGFISRFTFGSSVSLAPTPQDCIPPVPLLKADELGQIVADPFAKDGTVTAITESGLNPELLPSPEIHEAVIAARRKRSGTTATATSTLSSSTIDSTSSSREGYQVKRQSLGLALGGVSIGTTIKGIRAKRNTRAKKRKLVISGVDAHDTGAIQAVRGWCEAFGELRKFERQNNGNLVVDWRRKSVSDLVCRVQAKVAIKGAGSVSLSWYHS